MRFLIFAVVGAGIILCSLATPSAHAQTFGVLREVYTNISGGTIANLTNAPIYPNSPSFTNVVTALFEAPSDILESYGQRMRALLIPPVTGDYVFWVASDDNGALYLSTDEQPSNRALISSVLSWTNSR